MDMDQMIKSFPNQISEQHEALKDLSFNLDNFLNIDNIVIAGMGGSAISGDIIKLLLRDDIKYPINIVPKITALITEAYFNKSSLGVFSIYKY